MAILERDVVLQGRENGQGTIDLPITRLGNIEGGAEVKAALEDEDYIPVMDSADSGQMKKAPMSAFQQKITLAIQEAIGTIETALSEV